MATILFCLGELLFAETAFVPRAPRERGGSVPKAFRGRTGGVPGACAGVRTRERGQESKRVRVSVGVGVRVGMPTVVE